MNKTSELPEVPFLRFLYASIAGYLVIAIPAIGGILLLNLTDVKPLFFIFPITLLSIPISAAISWLIAKGSNWINVTAAIIAACSVPGRFYAVLFYFIARVITLRLGTRISKKVLADSVTQN